MRRSASDARNTFLLPTRTIVFYRMSRMGATQVLKEIKFLFAIYVLGLFYEHSFSSSSRRALTRHHTHAGPSHIDIKGISQTKTQEHLKSSLSSINIVLQ